MEGLSFSPPRASLAYRTALSQESQCILESEQWSSEPGRPSKLPPASWASSAFSSDLLGVVSRAPGSPGKTLEMAAFLPGVIDFLAGTFCKGFILLKHFAWSTSCTALSDNYWRRECKMLTCCSGLDSEGPGIILPAAKLTVLGASFHLSVIFSPVKWG